MKQLSIMLKPASSLCNMRCQYCFYADVSSLRDVASYGVMTEETAKAVLDHIFAGMEPGDRLTLAFQGGEPVLAGLDFFRRFTEEADRLAAKGVEVSYAIQTNGLLLDDDWCAFFRDRRFLVGLSLDGPAVYHDANRLDAERKGTFRRILETKGRLERHGVEYNVLTTLTNALARHPQRLWGFLEEQDIRYVQLIPCLGPMDGERSPYALTPERYASFYETFFRLWVQSFRRGGYRSVKLFDDLVNLLAFGQCNACGLLGRCQTQLIVEADGGVYPCDFYVLDPWKAGDLRQDSLRTVWDNAQRGGFLSREMETPAFCRDCPYRPICGGGCPRMRREVFGGGPGARMCGHRKFLDGAIGTLQEIALDQRRRG